MCTRYLSQRSSCWSVSSCDQPFTRYSTFYNPLLTIMLIFKEEQKIVKIPNVKLHNSFNNFGRDHIWIVKEWIWCTLSEEMAVETFTPIWSHVSENEKKNVKNHKSQISKFFFNNMDRNHLLWRACIYGNGSAVHFQGRCSKFFLPYGPMSRETKKNHKKSKMLIFWKKMPGDMVDV